MNDILVKSITRGRKVEPIRLYLRRDQYAGLWAGFRQRIIPRDFSVLSNLTVTSHLPRTHTLARIIYVIKLCRRTLTIRLDNFVSQRNLSILRILSAVLRLHDTLRRELITYVIMRYNTYW